jgi:glutamate-5-semialdehyde dehydrogenase
VVLNAPFSLTTTAYHAYQASLELATVGGTSRSRALQLMADAILENQNDILEANTLDLEISREMAVPELIIDWLKLTPERLQTAGQILRRLGERSDPIQQVINIPAYHVDQCQTYCQLMPLGVIAFVYEAFPSLGAIAAGLCIRTANSLILRGGSEASHSNRILIDILKSAIEDANLPSSCLQLLPSDEGDLTRELVVQEQYINLLIPYGRASLVQDVTRKATVPVLKTAIANCYLYWSPTASLDIARWMVLDSHLSEPDPVNAIEKIVINENHSPTALSRLCTILREKGFTVRGDAKLVASYPDLFTTEVENSEWSRAYLNKTVAFKSVENIETGIAWINRHSSGHADCLATESYAESRQFALGIGSATTYINTSPRFYRNPKQGSAIALGISSQKGHRRGLISVETLTTVKHVVQGSGA